MDSCGHLCKGIICFFNFIFAMLGIAFLGLGLWLRFGDNTRVMFEISMLNSSTFVIGVTVLIALGVVMLMAVMFGYYAACSGKKCAHEVFSALLFMLAVAEVVVGVLAYTRRGEVGARVAEFYNSLYTLFVSTRDVGLGVTLVFIHNTLHCCGVTGIPLVELVQETCPAPSGFGEMFAMHTCPGVIRDFFNDNATMVMGFFVGLGALLITTLVATIILLKQLKKDQTSYGARYSTVY
uniref:CD9 antigen isoform X2 n=1 Tax=Doryrhamphus excisus TaxID=161450 RepID=UPI0025AE1644|nr:CD9 antigen isoform X2 [Doryrhamphus excisus]